nr:hypothetical protein CDL12_23042 [Ipomoea trifida]
MFLQPSMKSGNLDPNPFPAKLRYLSTGKLLTLDQSGASKVQEPYLLKIANLMRKNSTEIVAGKVELKSKKTKSGKSPMAGGIDPLKLFPLMLKPVRLEKEVKSRLDSDHELSEEDINKLLFHWRRASASVLVDADAKKQAGSTRKMISAI